MEWVCVYLTLVKNLPVLGVGEADYKTEEACLNANAGTKDTFWCVTRNWLDEGQRNPCVLRDRLNIVKWDVASANCYARRDVGRALILYDAARAFRHDGARSMLCSLGR